MKKAFNIAKEIISWVLLIAVLFAFAFSVYTNIANKNEGEGAFLLGYRPVLVLTGSMEPYMKTNGLVLTKAVSDIDELAVGDVITYHVENLEGKLLRITHRIIEIDGEKIYTKGDNNSVDDGFPLTIENVEAKVVAVANWTAWFVAKWQSSTAGKVMLISLVVGVILLYFCIKDAIKALLAKRKGKTDEKEAGAAEVIEGEVSEEAAAAEEQTRAEETEPSAETTETDNQSAEQTK